MVKIPGLNTAGYTGTAQVNLAGRDSSQSNVARLMGMVADAVAARNNERLTARQQAITQRANEQQLEAGTKTDLIKLAVQKMLAEQGEAGQNRRFDLGLDQTERTNQKNFQLQERTLDQNDNQFMRELGLKKDSLNQSGDQFNRQLNQSGDQFNRQLNQQGSQFEQELGFKNRQFNQQGYQFDRQFDQQGSQFDRKLMQELLMQDIEGNQRKELLNLEQAGKPVDENTAQLILNANQAQTLEEAIPSVQSLQAMGRDDIAQQLIKNLGVKFAGQKLDAGTFEKTAKQLGPDFGQQLNVSPGLWERMIEMNPVFSPILHGIAGQNKPSEIKKRAILKNLQGQ